MFQKLGIKNEELELVKRILECADYLTSKVDFKYSNGISQVIEICIDAIDFVEENENITDVEKKKELIIEKALQLCHFVKLPLDNGNVEIIHMIVDYLIK